MRQFSIFLLAFFVWLVVPSLGLASCLTLFVYFCYRTFGLIRLADSDLLAGLATDLEISKQILGAADLGLTRVS
jgi:hypothetical protein